MCWRKGGREAKYDVYRRFDAYDIAMKGRSRINASSEAEAPEQEGEPHQATAAPASPIVLQARESAALIVRSADGEVYFARQLAAGEAYRAPDLRGLVIDVSEPTAFQVFVNGQTRGLLPGAQTPLSRLGD